MTEVPYHPLANIFPLLEGLQFRDLVEDVRINGLQEPIVLFEGAILDGRNRARACIAAQVPARYKTYDGRDPVAFVVSANLHRRHLDVSQRAMIAADISERKNGLRHSGPSSKIGGKVAQRVRSDRYRLSRQTDRRPEDANKVSGKEAARLLGVAQASVTHARKVVDAGIPELSAAVRAGEMSVSAAATVAAFGKVQQRNIRVR